MYNDNVVLAEVLGDTGLVRLSFGNQYVDITPGMVESLVSNQTLRDLLRIRARKARAMAIANYEADRLANKLSSSVLEEEVATVRPIRIANLSAKDNDPWRSNTKLYSDAV